jgi:hypothetical protein
MCTEFLGSRGHETRHYDMMTILVAIRSEIECVVKWIHSKN